MRLLTVFPELRRVLVNTKTGKTFSGALWRRRRGMVVLKGAELVKPGGGARLPLDGDLVVLADNIDFIQVLS